jgi:hypothetical protein
MTRSPETIDEVRAEMRQIRSNLDDEVATLAESTRVLFDWRSYLKHAPWLCLGAAAVTAYLLVPSKPKVVTPTPEQMAELAKQARVTIGEVGSQQKAKTLGQELMGVALGLVLRTGLQVATQQFNQFLNRPPGPTGPSEAGGPQR